MKKILLADDSVTIQKVVELTFIDEQYEVIAVGTGDKGQPFGGRATGSQSLRGLQPSA